MDTYKKRFYTALTISLIVMGVVVGSLTNIGKIALGQTGIGTIDPFKFSGTTITPRNASSSLQIPSLGASGNPCISVNASGTLATTTCGGAGSGSVSTSSAITVGYVPFWTSVAGALSGTSNIYQGTSSVGIGTTQPSVTSTVEISDSTNNSTTLRISSTWNNVSTNFTALKVAVTNTTSGSNSVLADFSVGGSSQFTLARNGNVSNVGSITPVANAIFQWAGRSVLSSPASGQVLFKASNTDYNLLNFGATTASFPALKISSSSLSIGVRLGDDSADANFTAASATFSGIVRVSDGTNLVPSYSFTSATGTGLSYSGGAIVVSRLGNSEYVTGSEGFRIKNTLGVAFSSGAPDVAASDTNISRVSAGLLGVGTGAQGSIAGSLSAASYTSAISAGFSNFLGSNSLAGGGASLELRNDQGTSAYALLRNYGSTNAASLFGQTAGNFTVLGTDGASSNGLTIGTFTTDPVILGTNNTAVLTISSSGLVGIGTSTPSKLLTVVGNQAGGIMRVQREPGSGVTVSQVYGTYDIALMMATSTMPDQTGPALTFSAGTSSQTLFVQGDIASARDGADNNGRVVIRPYLAGVAQNVLYVTSNGRVGVGLSANVPQSTLAVVAGSGAVPFSVASSSGGEYFRINNDGSVGIGTGAPSSTLHVVGPIQLSATSSVAREGAIWNDVTDKNFEGYVGSLRRGFDGTFFSATSTATVNNTSTETSIIPVGAIGTSTLPANIFVPGKAICLDIAGIYGLPLAGGSATIKVKYATSTVATVVTTGLLGNQQGERFEGNICITGRTTGTTGTVGVDGKIGYSTSAATHAYTFDPLNNGGVGVTIDTTRSAKLDVTITWSAADTAQSATTTKAIFTIH